MEKINVETHLCNLNNSVDNLCHTRPFQEDILRAFQKVYEQRLRLAALFSQQTVPLPDFDRARIAQGISWLVGASLASYEGMLRESTEAMLSTMAQAFPSGCVFSDAKIFLLKEDFDLPGACQMLLEGNLSGLSLLADEFAFDPALFRFILEMILGPVATLLGARVQQLIQKDNWQEGYCPVCGQPPSISYLAKPEKIGLESLVGGGGQKYLHCSLCSHIWRYRRDACPGCGNCEPKTREIINTGEARHERIELCQQCKGYILCVDFREFEQEPDLLITPVALMHLDIIARNRGGLPLHESPWNSGS